MAGCLPSHSERFFLASSDSSASDGLRERRFGLDGWSLSPSKQAPLGDGTPAFVAAAAAAAAATAAAEDDDDAEPLVRA